LGLTAREHPHEFPGQVRSPDDPTFGVVVEAEALFGGPMVLGLDGFLAQGGELEELFLVGGEAVHGGTVG
jgi:hypothetical protein